MKKLVKVLAMGGVGAMLLTPMNAIAAPAKQEVQVPVSVVSPRFSYDYEETITRTYNSKADIPQTYYYEYYSNDWSCWFRGTLNLTKTTAKGKKFIATFSGTMYGSPT